MKFSAAKFAPKVVASVPINPTKSKSLNEVPSEKFVGKSISENVTASFNFIVSIGAFVILANVAELYEIL